MLYPETAELVDKIFQIKSEEQFIDTALKVFRFQAENNPVYRDFIGHLKINYQEVQKLDKIPFLPIQFFKTHKVVLDNVGVQETFTSSGTTGHHVSKHFVHDTDLYIKSFTKGFENFYGNINDWVILALLPSYLEREGSSLVYMVDHLIKESGKEDSGFYLNNREELAETIKKLEGQNKKSLLIGVSYALLDFAEEFPMPLKNIMMMETGGMKGRRKEILREELHQKLCDSFQLDTIHSEYGMTELLSQAYSKGNGIFQTPSWMKILIRETNDPFDILTSGKSGGINIIDLANIYSCSFIATQDLGKIHDNKGFEVLGRFDNSDLRGCNLMVV